MSSSDEFVFFPQPAPFHQRLVDRQIKSALIFVQKYGLGNMIEELLDHRQQGGRIGDQTCGQTCFCQYVRFHSAAVILRQAGPARLR